MKIEYDSNNSGGSWWLKDKDWQALEAAGWQVDWKPSRWLGALATSASKDFETPGQAMREFEKVTGQSVTDEGCNCCGAPHSFSWGSDSAYGEECAQHIYDKAPSSYRGALEEIERLKGKRK